MYDPSETVTVKVTVTIRPITVPQVVGMRVENATTAMAKRHIKVTLLKVPSTKVDGLVLAQRIRAGEDVAPGSTVRLKVVHPHLCGTPPNKWCFSVYGSGGLIYDPPRDICDYGFGINCIASFWESTNGYVIQCINGEFSHSGGVQGSCSGDNRGNWRPLYRP